MSQLKGDSKNSIDNEDRKMRILFTSDSLSISGIRSLILELIAKLDSRKFETAVAVIKPLKNGDAFYLAELSERNIPVESLNLTHPQALFPIGVKRMKKVIKDFNPDVIFATTLPDCFFVVRAAASMNIALISMFNGVSDLEDLSRFKKRVLLDHLEFSDGIITLTEHVKKSYPRQSPTPIEVFPPIIDVRRFSPKNTRPSIAKGGLTIGSIITDKDITFLPIIIEIFSVIHKRLPFVKRLVIAGEKSEHSKVKNAVIDFGTSDFVDLLGPKEDILSVYHEIDFMLSMKDSESLGTAVLEGMSCRVIPIVSENSIMPGIINQGDNGFYLMSQEKESIIQMLDGIFVDCARYPAKFNRIAKTARETVQGKFDSAKTVRRYEELFLRIAMNRETEK